MKKGLQAQGIKRIWVMEAFCLLICVPSTHMISIKTCQVTHLRTPTKQNVNFT